MTWIAKKADFPFSFNCVKKSLKMGRIEKKSFQSQTLEIKQGQCKKKKYDEKLGEKRVQVTVI